MSANVGIGTAAPRAKLHVFGGGNVDPSLSYGSSATAIINGGSQDIAFGGALTASPWSAWMQVRGWSSTAGNLAINPLGGNVGIGTMNPADKLEVSGSGIRVSVPSAGPWPFTLYRSDTDMYWYLFNDSGLHFYYRPTTGGTPAAKLSILENGNVGIRTTNPYYRLDVAGSSRIFSSVGNVSLAIQYGGSGGRQYHLISCAACSTGGAGTFEIYDATAAQPRAFIASGVNGWQTPSDRRLKTDIQSLSVLDKLGPLRAVSYVLKESGQPQIGVIAQELQRSFPLAVTGAEKPGQYLGVSYDAVAAIALEGVKELKAENDTLRAALKAANDNDAAIDALRHEIETLKASR